MGVLLNRQYGFLVFESLLLLPIPVSKLLLLLFSHPSSCFSTSFTRSHFGPSLVFSYIVASPGEDQTRERCDQVGKND